MQIIIKRTLIDMLATCVGVALFSASAQAAEQVAELYVYGGITTVVQQINSSEPEVVGKFGSALSVDLFLEKDVHDGKALIYINHSQGYDPLPYSNGDYEGASGGKPGDDTYDAGFSDTRLAEAFYEAPLPARMTLTVGKLRPQRYFDNNIVASNQTRQFLGNAFVNNSAIDFPGHRPTHAYPGGIRLSAVLGQQITLQGALFEDAEDYSGTFGATFAIAEADVTLGYADAITNLRFILWNSNRNQTRGIALSADRHFGDDYAVFLRYGTKTLPTTPPGDKTEEDLERSLKTAYSVGGQAEIGYGFTAGLGYSVETPNASTLAQNSWIEAYVSYAVNDSVHIAVDYQSIRNKIFIEPINRAVASANVIAGRLQVDF